MECPRRVNSSISSSTVPFVRTQATDLAATRPTRSYVVTSAYRAEVLQGVLGELNIEAILNYSSCIPVIIQLYTCNYPFVYL